MPGRQGFITNHQTYVYQESPASKSASFGLDSTDNYKWKLKASQLVNASPSGTAQLSIDSRTDGDITLTPNGLGNIIAAYMTAGAVVSSSTGNLTSSGAGTSGQVLTSNGAGFTPTFQYFPSGGINWSRETLASVAMVISHGYINTNVGLTTFTLPATAALGTVIAIMGESAAGWKIAQNVGQNIQFGNISTAVGVLGALSSSNQYDCVYIVCRVADTTWSVVSSVGVLAIV